jgi:hypothetical protein
LGAGERAVFADDWQAMGLAEVFHLFDDVVPSQVMTTMNCERPRGVSSRGAAGAAGIQSVGSSPLRQARRSSV